MCVWNTTMEYEEDQDEDEEDENKRTFYSVEYFRILRDFQWYTI